MVLRPPALAIGFGINVITPAYSIARLTDFVGLAQREQPKTGLRSIR